MTEDASTVIWFDRVGLSDVPRVGGKNASLGEMIRNLGAEGHPRSARLRNDGGRLLAVRS